jgi:hypothetical protein
MIGKFMVFFLEILYFSCTYRSTIENVNKIDEIRSFLHGEYIIYLTHRERDTDVNFLGISAIFYKKVSYREHRYRGSGHSS